MRRIVLGPGKRQRAETADLTPLERMVRETEAAAASIDYPWDAQALDWPLTPESVVLEIGSYKGRWALQMACRFNPRLFCFEPQSWACAVTWKALESYNARVFNYGLGERDALLPMGHFGTDGASFIDTEGDAGDGTLREIGAVLKELQITEIDLALVNIEGYEYILVPHMLKQKILPRFLMIQCHGLGAPNGFDALRTALAEYYTVKWDYGYSLAAWELKT